MALFRKIFYRRPPDGLMEISERVYVFDCCFATESLEDDGYKVYVGGVVRNLREYVPDASCMVFNFREGKDQSQIASLLSEYDMTIMDYPRRYEGCPLVTVDTLDHFLRSSESWLSLAQQNVLLMHCERGGWPVLAFMLAAFLTYRKQASGEQKTLDTIYKQAPRGSLQLMSPVNPVPSQLRYLQYVSQRDEGSQWPPAVQALTLDCVILRSIPEFDNEGGCGLVIKIYGQDPSVAADRTAKLVSSTPRRSKAVRHYKKEAYGLVKIEIQCHVQGDIVLECVSLDSEREKEEMMFRVMFNTAFVKSYNFILNRDEIDVPWNAREQFHEDFRAEVFFTEMDAPSNLVSDDIRSTKENGGRPVVEAFAKVQEIFGDSHCLNPKSDSAANAFQRNAAPNILKESLDPGSPWTANSCSLSGIALEKAKERTKLMIPEDASPASLPRLSVSCNSIQQKVEPQELQIAIQRTAQSKIISPRVSRSSISTPVPNGSSFQGSPLPVLRCPSAISSLGITALLQDHDSSKSEEVGPPVTVSSSSAATTTSITHRQLISKKSNSFPNQHSDSKVSLALSKASHRAPPHPPPSTPNFSSYTSTIVMKSSPAPPPLLVSPSPPPMHTSDGTSKSSIDSCLSKPSSPFCGKDLDITSDLFPPLHLSHSVSGVASISDQSVGFTQPSLQTLNSLARRPCPPPPPPPPPPPAPPLCVAVSGGTARPSLIPSQPSLSVNKPTVTGPPPPPQNSGSAPCSSPVPPPPPPPPPQNSGSAPCSSPVPPHILVKKCSVPCSPPVPPPAPEAFPKSNHSVGNKIVPPIAGSPTSEQFAAKGRRSSCGHPRSQSQPRKANLKPYHWLKLTRVMQGSIWAETQKSGEATATPEFDISELERLFSVAAPTSEVTKSDRRATGPKSGKVQLIELRRAYNCEIMLSKVKIPLPDLMGSILSLDESALDVDQVTNLIKFCPTEDEMKLLKGYPGDKENLGRCEKFFLELMKVPRVESKLRVFSFKMQFCTQVSDLTHNLNVINCAAEEIRSSIKLKRIMQAILSLGNALNHGTARGSAIGFRLDSLLKLTDTRSRNNKMTLMHYLCKVLAEKLPELLDFPEDLVSLEPATKIQLKCLAEEMQAIRKGLEEVEKEFEASEKDGPVSATFREALKEFLTFAECEVRSLASLYSVVGRSADALAHYFGEDPVRVPFEQVVSTLLNFVRLFVRAHEENCRHLDYEKKKAQREVKNEKLRKRDTT